MKDRLTDIEKLVMDLFLNHTARPDDIPTIAKIAKITEVQASVAVQLLRYKHLIPSNNREALL